MSVSDRRQSIQTQLTSGEQCWFRNCSPPLHHHPHTDRCKLIQGALKETISLSAPVLHCYSMKAAVRTLLNILCFCVRTELSAGFLRSLYMNVQQKLAVLRDKTLCIFWRIALWTAPSILSFLSIEANIYSSIPGMVTTQKYYLQGQER